MEPFEIAPTEVQACLVRGDDLVLLDVQEPEELSLARIVGAVHIPMREIPARQVELDEESRIVVICHLSQRSVMVTQFLREQGFDWVRNLSGGINAWTREVDPGVGFY